jgi:hypothetical protein
MHRRLADDVSSGQPKSTLEIGAGTLNQLPYEPLSNPFDIIEPFHDLYEASPYLERVRNIYDDIKDVPLSARYERIISVAVLEHICNLPEVIARSGLLLTDGGQFRAGIPSEGTILWKLAWQNTTGVAFKRRHNLDYEVLMKYEHVNAAREIEEVLRYFFAEVKGRVFGLVPALSLYQFYACANPRREECRAYLASLGIEHPQ